MEWEFSNYRENISSSSVVLTAWEYTAARRSQTIVIPDGCRDLIIEVRRGGRVRCFVSELSRSAYSVKLHAGVHMVGLRLQPGVRIDEHALFGWLNHNDPVGLLKTDQLDEFCERPCPVTDALACLQSGVPSVAMAARSLGISSRTLQRTVKQLSGETPHFWLALARVRRACRTLHQFERLADAATTCGFADQAHMTREVRSWLGVTPTEIWPGGALLAQLNDSGYG